MTSLLAPTALAFRSASSRPSYSAMLLVQLSQFSRSAYRSLMPEGDLRTAAAAEPNDNMLRRIELPILVPRLRDPPS
jgi:hypothetical protein